MVKYTVRLPTGNEYGPADLATLRAWHREGRVGADSWVWTEGAPEWVPLANLLETGTNPPVASGSARGPERPAPTGPKAAAAARPRPASARRPAPGPTPTAAAKPAPARPVAAAKAGAEPTASSGAETPGHVKATAPGSTAGSARPQPRAKPGPPASPGAARPGTARGPRPRSPRPSAARGAGSSGAWILLAGTGLVVLLLIGVAVQVLVLPRLESWRAASQLQSEALPEGRFADPEAGLLLEAPGSWVLLRPDSSLLVAPLARARLAHATLGARATLTVQRQPPGLAPLDDVLDEVVGERRALVNDYLETGRSQAVLAGRPAQRLTATWSEGGVEQRATAIATRDVWVYVALLAWGPASGGTELEAAFESLAGGLDIAGALEQRIARQATELLAAFPELSRPSVELLLRFQAEGDAGPAQLAAAVVTTVDRGLSALDRDETLALRQIYAQVFEPLSDADRQRLAAWQQAVRQGRPLDRAEALAVRGVLRSSLGAIPGETLVELQALHEKAIFAGAPRS